MLHDTFSWDHFGIITGISSGLLPFTKRTFLIRTSLVAPPHTLSRKRDKACTITIKVKPKTHLYLSIHIICNHDLLRTNIKGSNNQAVTWVALQLHLTWSKIKVTQRTLWDLEKIKFGEPFLGPCFCVWAEDEASIDFMTLVVGLLGSRSRTSSTTFAGSNILVQVPVMAGYTNTEFTKRSSQST